LKWADEIGINKVCDTINKLHGDYQDDRYRTSLLLKKMASENARFFS
jgi:3-hydroxybutyryl-CoA dehydrogenase